MPEIRTRVGPRGQVVIPRVLRDLLRIGPGSEVTLSLEEGGVVLRASRYDTVDVFERIARSGKVIDKPSPHAAYERSNRRRRM